MKKSLRGFGIGIFLVGALLYINSQYSIPFIEAADQEESYKKQIAELKKQVSEQQQQISDFNTLAPLQEVAADTVEDASETKAPDKTENNAPEEQQANDDESVITGTIYVYETVSLYDIGKQAEDLGIVQNGRELELYLSKPEFARSIQKGQFELSSDMTYEGMAKLLTGKK